MDDGRHEAVAAALLSAMESIQPEEDGSRFWFGPHRCFRAPKYLAGMFGIGTSFCCVRAGSTRVTDRTTCDDGHEATFYVLVGIPYDDSAVNPWDDPPSDGAARQETVKNRLRDDVEEALGVGRIGGADSAYVAGAEYAFERPGWTMIEATVLVRYRTPRRAPQ